MQVSLNLQKLHPNTRSFKANETRTQNANNIQQYQNKTQVISFAGKKNQVAIIAGEAKDYIQTGGVATVGQDFSDGKLFAKGSKTESILFLPYYNGQVTNELDPAGTVLPDSSGSAKYKKAEVLMKDGQPIFTKKILQQEGISVNELKPDEYFILEKVSSKKMEVAGEVQDIAMYKVKCKGDKTPVKSKVFMVFTEGTARMRKPYDSAGGGYSSKLRSLGEPDPYAMFSKATVEMMPDLEAKGIAPKHWLLNDAQTGYVSEYINLQNRAGNPYYSDVKSSFVIHNAGLGYQVRQDAKTMALNFATNDDIKFLNENAQFQALEDYQKELVYRESIKPFLTSDHQATAVMVPLRHCQDGAIVTHVSTVAPSYAASVAKGNGDAAGIKDILHDMYSTGKFSGILNGLDNAGLDPTQQVGLAFFKETKNLPKPITLANGEVLSTVEPFKTFSIKDPIEKIVQTKQENAKNLFLRLQPGVPYQFSLGKKNPTYDRLGYIDHKFVEMINKGKHVDTYITWGRADDQKGLDIVIDSFRKFLKTPKGKKSNSVLIMGGELKGSHLEEYMRGKIDLALAECEGRFVFMDGFAPGKVLSMAGEIPIFPSRWAPCELTDLESMKSGCTPIVTGFQGLDDKNFDIRDNAKTATGYKTKFTMDTDLHKIKLNDLSAENRKIIETYRAEYDKIMMMQERELRATRFENGVKYSEEDIAKLLKRFEIKSENYTDGKGVLKKLRTKTIDQLVINDIVAAMEDRAGRSANAKQIMMTNAMQLSSGWQTNGQIQHLSDGKILSAAELYQQRHFAPKVKSQSQFGYRSIKEVFLSLFGNKSETTATAQAATNPVMETIGDTIKEVKKQGTIILTDPPSAPPKKFLSRETAIAVLGIAALGSLAYYIFKPEKSDNAAKEKDSGTYIA